MHPGLIKALPVIGYASFALMIVLTSAINLYHAPRIGTAKVPMQWDFSGNPVWFGSKLVGLWFPVLLGILVGSMQIYKIRQAEAQPLFWDWIILIALCCFVLGVHAWHISAIAAWAEKQS
jgi:hypothetical protein